jgi:hypothetical protein
MNSTIHDRTEPASSPALQIAKKMRWFGVAFGLLLGLAAVCHGCHAGDHDDELSVGDAVSKRSAPTSHDHEIAACKK